MSRRAARTACVAALAAFATLASALSAQPASVSSAQVTGVEMTAPVRRALRQLEEQWLQWVVQTNRQGSERVVEDLLATARQIGMTRLPDLSVGALARAVQAARQGDFERARWSLDAAEKLDPGRAETAFAEATVDRLQGSYAGAAAAQIRGYARLFGLPLESYLWLQNLLVWGLSLLLLTGGLFIAVQMAVKGSLLWNDMVSLFARRLPRPVAVALTVVLLLWPLALPSGILWLPLFWSLLLWGYSSASERAVLVVLWLLVGVAPVLISGQSRRVAVTLSPPVQAMESLRQHRLYGGLFTDLGLLRSVLPDRPAVRHLLADVHRSLGQWDLAQNLYRQVLQEEPENTHAEMNLGAFAFLKGDFGSAIQHFQKVATTDPANASAQFNLSQAYSESYLFNESRRALAQAREIDDSRVDVWVRNLGQQRVVTNSQGLARIPEIRRDLLASFRTSGEATARLEQFRRWLSLSVPVILLLLAVALHLARRSFRDSEAEPYRYQPRSRWWRALLPGAPSAEVGEGGKAFLALLLPTALLMLPMFGRIGYRIPWGYDPGNFAAWIVAILGLSLYMGLRLRRELSDEV
ncbi:MAG TPA: tetratricopeptide repeat protein [Thermoanaerobaculia bacterium]